MKTLMIGADCANPCIFEKVRRAICSILGRSPWDPLEVDFWRRPTITRTPADVLREIFDAHPNLDILVLGLDVEIDEGMSRSLLSGASARENSVRIFKLEPSEVLELTRDAALGKAVCAGSFAS